MNTLHQLQSFIQNLWARPYVSEVVLIVVICLVMWLLAVRTFRWTHAHAQNWISALEPGLSLPETVKDSFSVSLAAPDEERNRIEAQFQQVRSRAKHHLDVMVDFYSWYYVAIVMASSAATIAAIALFWITKTGWTDAPAKAIVLFVLATAVAIYYRAFPGMFRQEQNIAENKKLYLEYAALKNEVKSYCVTGENMQGARLSCTQFIHYLDSRMAILNNVALGFDPTKLPTYKDLQNSTGPRN